MEIEILINRLEMIKEILNPIPVADNEWAIEKLTQLIKLLEDELADKEKACICMAMHMSDECYKLGCRARRK